MAEAGQFRHDLLDRLSFEVLFLPALRERGRGDIDLLARHFAGSMASELGLASVPEFSEAALAALRGYGWPGNVRELKNVIERAVSRAEGGVIQEIVFDPFRAPGKSAGRASTSAATIATATLPVDLPALIADLEQRLLRQAMDEARFRQREAAPLLGLSYDQFRGLYRKYPGALEKGAA